MPHLDQPDEMGADVSMMRADAAAALFTLKRPQSVAIYDSHADAQRAVDYLADNRFPVKNLAIVGTDLKIVERVTGELSWGKVLLSGAASGVVYGLMFSVFVWLLMPQIGLTGAVLYGVLLGVIAGAASNALNYALTRGSKDYSSLTQTIATHYEVLAEAEVAGQARTLLGGGPAQTAAADRVRGIDNTAQPTADAGQYPPPVYPQPEAGSWVGQGPVAAPRLQDQPGQPMPAPSPLIGGAPVAPRIDDAPGPDVAGTSAAGAMPEGQQPATVSQPDPDRSVPDDSDPYRPVSDDPNAPSPWSVGESATQVEDRPVPKDQPDA